MHQNSDHALINMYEMQCKHAVQISYTYCNGFDQRNARQQLGKHLPLVLHDNWEYYSSCLGNSSLKSAASNIGKWVLCDN
jgi:hypothetical protein